MLLQTLETRTLFAFGDLDPTFFGDGTGVIQFGQRSVDSVYATIAQPDGKIIVAGSTNDGFGGTDLAVARLNPDASLDLSFGMTLDGAPGGGLYEIVEPLFNSDTFYDVDLQSDGKIVLVGTVASENFFTGVTELSQAVVVRLNPDGTPDLSFGDEGGVILPLSVDPFTGLPNSDGHAIGVQSTGKIVIGGAADIDSINQTSSFAIARLNPDGSLDPTFGESGTGIDTESVPGLTTAVLGLDITSDDKIVFTGTATAPSDGFNPATGIFVTARTSPDGIVDESFGGGLVLTEFPRTDEFSSVIAFGTTVVVQPDGKTLVGGFVLRDLLGIPYSSIALARYDQFGNPDLSFGGGPLAAPGTMETFFYPDEGGGANLAANQIRLQPDGSFFVSGRAAPALTTNDEGSVVALYRSNGSLDTDFSDDGLIVILPGAGELGVKTLSSRFSTQAVTPQATGSPQAGGAGAFVENVPGGGILILASGAGGQLTAARLIPDGADLVTSTGGVKAGTFLGGAKGTTTVTFSNQGNLTFSGSVPISLFLSTDGAAGNDIPITTTAPVSLTLAPGTSKTFTVKYVYPKGSNVNGNYFILATANETGAISEGNVVNNASVAATQVAVKPAFVEISVTLVTVPASAVSGKKAAFALQVTNSGTIASKGKVTLQLFASADEIFGNDTLLAGGKPVNLAVKPGNKTLRLNGLVPKDFSAGTYTLLLRLDATGVSNVNPIRELNTGKTITIS